jgi:diguanylate cyclase (GGDEF)-like protein/putative nucleotidyltransferase with HDIG domain
LLTGQFMVACVMCAGAALLAAFFAYMYSLKRQRYLLAWSGAWVLVALQSSGRVFPMRGNLGQWQQGINSWMMALAALFFLCAAQLYSHRTVWIRTASIAALAAAVWAAANQYGRFEIPLSFGVALLLVAVAGIFWREGKKQGSHADHLLGLAFLAWGLLLFGTAFQNRFVWLKDADLRLPMLLPQLFAGVLMVMTVYEEERRRVEHNMLALSNLNLATSSFVGGEIQKMLAQALDRVLNVVRIPAGALCLHYGDIHGPTSVVATGLSEAFCADVQEEDLDDYVVRLVAGLGGLVVLPDLARDQAWVALDREEPFRRVRKLLVAQGLRTVVGISLQAKERAFGVLLLGTPDHRPFTPAELRLLLALGHQIGMAVENSYLIQQTARRSEELHILNEIGRALSSTLDLDTLFEKIYTEMKRLFDVSNFYIGFYDSRREEIRFELDVVDGVRGPKRARPVGNHLTEYMIRTRQPMLIRDNFVEEARKLGVEPLQPRGCFCGVPLVLYDRAIGVMAVHSRQERLFDEGHLELLRVLAGEAGVAIENARLFAEEQKKSHHLTLLNNLSGHAITTLNPDEMLAKIAAELEDGLTYDDIGIAILDYSAKELVIQAEAGRRRSALGRRIALGEGLVGQVARTGQMVMVNDVHLNSPRPVLPDTASAIALPITYADQLLGVLYAESADPCDFPEEEILLLRTLADLFAGALHNALTFQKAQEQAITDGLTGVKTHRFLMEALSAEWKRSTRAGRPFSLVLMDLDRFKFVNDFYGHLEGDAVLQRVGSILEESCRRSDVVARYGGDEFVILMPETNADQAGQLASKLRSSVASDPLLHDKNITASFGIAAFPLHGSTPQELIQVADSSMYLSKHQGGNAVSTAEQNDSNETKKWKRDVLEAYLGVTLKRQFSTGPQAFEEILQRLEHFTRSLTSQEDLTTAEQLPSAVVDTVTSLALAVDAKDPYTQGHSKKVSAYAAMIAQGLSLGPAEIEEMRLAGLLHDVGKVGIPEAILNKAGPLDASEWDTMKSHTQLGAKLLEPLGTLGRIQKMVLHHHEFYDGSGYPDCLGGEQIPFGARIIAIADAYDTITSDRTYKKARTPDDAFAELERCSATQFDPELLRVFIEVMRRQPRPLVQVSVPVADSTEAPA